MREVLARCERLRAETGGYFDARAARAARPVGPRQGLGGRPRGGAAVGGGRAPLLRQRGRRRGRARRAVAGRRPAPAAARPRRGGALADRRRRRHLGRLRARRAHPRPAHAAARPRGALAVTVLGRDLATADAYATAAFAMGERGPAWTARLRGCGAMTILAGDRVLCTERFLRHRVPCLSGARRRRECVSCGHGGDVPSRADVAGEAGHGRWRRGVHAFSRSRDRARRAGRRAGAGGGAELSVSERLQDRREVAAGTRAQVLGFEDGRFYANGWHITGEMGGIVTPPLKLLDSVYLGVNGQWVGAGHEVHERAGLRPLRPAVDRRPPARAHRRRPRRPARRPDRPRS